MTEENIKSTVVGFSENLHIDFDEEGDVRKASMLGYSGKPMEHPWFGQIIVDVAGIDFRHPRIPILEDHDGDKKIGFADKVDLEKNQVYFDEITVLDNEIANEFYKNAKKGFPYQASISIYPKKIEELADDKAFAEVNGYKVKGPGIIFRESVFRESSVVTFGMDHRTNTEAYNEALPTISLSEADAKTIKNFLKKEEPKETNMSDEKFTELENKLKEYEAKLAESDQKAEQYAEQLEMSKGQIEELRKNRTNSDFSSKIGDEDASFLMEFYGKLPTEDLEKIADKIASFQKAIKEIGEAKGSGDLTNPSKEPTHDEVTKYAKENNISFVEANRILYKKRG